MEKEFKFKESFGDAIRVMDDETAGQFVKSLCDFAFNGNNYEGNDPTVKGCFALAKAALSEENSAAEKSGEAPEIVCLAKNVVDGLVAGEIFKDFLSFIGTDTEKKPTEKDETEAENPTESDAKTVAKTRKNEAG